MAYRFFTIPIRCPETAQSELNTFLRSHRVLSVERRWVDQGESSFWAFCVDYLESSGAPVPMNKESRDAPGRNKVDYRERLSPGDFTIFTRLRDLRKEIAQAEAVPVYAIFTNEQLARMVQSRATSKAVLETIVGVGDARIEKYGARVLEFLRRQWEGDGGRADAQGRANCLSGSPTATTSGWRPTRRCGGSGRSPTPARSSSGLTRTWTRCGKACCAATSRSASITSSQFTTRRSG